MYDAFSIIYSYEIIGIFYWDLSSRLIGNYSL